MIDDNYNFPENLKRLREERNLNGTHFAELLNIVQQTYSNYELGIRTPSIFILMDIARILEVSLDTLILRHSYAVHDEDMPDTVIHPAKEDVSDPEQRLLYYFRLLSPTQQNDVIDYCEFKQKRYCDENIQ